jgi:hypothetical protein
MATRQQAADFIRTKWVNEEVSPYVFKFDVEYNQEGRSQEVYALVTEGEIQFTSAFAFHSQVSAHDALNINVSMFGVVTVADVWALKHNAFLQDLDESEIIGGVLVLAMHADVLEGAFSSKDSL